MTTPTPSGSAPITEQEVVGFIEAKVRDFGSAKKAADAWGCSVQMVHLVRRGERRPTASMLSSVGVRAVTSLVTAYFKEENATE